MAADKDKRLQRLWLFLKGGRIYVNCKWQKQLKDSPDLNWLITQGYAVMKRDGQPAGRATSVKKRPGKRQSVLILTAKGIVLYNTLATKHKEKSYEELFDAYGHRRVN